MTITCQPMDATSGFPAYSAQNERQAMAALFGGGGGVALAARSGFRVGTPSNILTATSTQWTLGPCSAVISPGAATAQGSYRWATDQNVTGAVTAADATYTRKDIVYIQVNDSSSGDGSGALTANVLYAAGTPSATPVAPDLTGSRARSFLVGTITVPQTGGGSPTVVLNPAVFVAAGAPQPVKDQTERDALSLYDGLSDKRMDLTGRPVETYDGSAWWQTPAASATTAVTDGFWTITGNLIKTVVGGQTQVTASLQMVRLTSGITVTTAGNALIVGMIPSGYRPPGNFSLIGSVLTNADGRYAEPELIVNNGGSVVGRSVSGGDITIGVGYKLYISGTWFL